MTKEKLALEIIERLKKEYPDADCTLDYDQAWKLLVSVRLAAQCTDARVNVVVEKLYEKYPDVQFLMVNATDGVQETMASAKEYVEQEGFQFDVFFDTNFDAVNAYQVSGFPATFFIDENGNLVTYGRGMLDFETLEKGIQMITE